MAESRDLRDLFERDLRQIAVPPESEWFATAPTERPTPRWLLATTAIAAIVVALVFGSYLYSRLPGRPGSGSTPTPSPAELYTVTGRLTDAATGQAVPGVRVFFDPASGPCCRQTDFVGPFSGLTDGSGGYRVQVQPGNYRVLFLPWRSGQAGVCVREPCANDPIAPVPYQALWWPNGTAMTEANNVTVDHDRSGIDGAVSLGHEIVGSVIYRGVPQRAFILVQRVKEEDLVALAMTNGDGTFRVAVPDGSYYVTVLPWDSCRSCSPSSGPHAATWFGDVVVHGADVLGIDLELQ